VTTYIYHDKLGYSADKMSVDGGGSTVLLMRPEEDQGIEFV
jgi:hypothetical protein